MWQNRLRRCWKSLLGLYLISFCLPVGSYQCPGIIAFFASLCGSLVFPPLLVYWFANPLFWHGLACLRSGRWLSAVISGGLSGAFACLWLIPMFSGQTSPVGREDLLLFGGYFAWMASTVLLAVVSLAGWLIPRLHRRPRFRLSWLMIVIATVALGLAVLPPFVRLLVWFSKPWGTGIGAPG
ncbi:hypothetical protein V5E97_06165 [Singulisphaera sp. Ch08]|uniref:Uncharacterized protein n=1 Tax=Singulisphaera sp. Ch08 TaxID=3120278 RepID=A0AAU7CJG0_9BACT